MSTKDVSPYGLLDMPKYEEIIQLGYNTARVALGQWLANEAPDSIRESPGRCNGVIATSGSQKKKQSACFQMNLFYAQCVYERYII